MSKPDDFDLIDERAEAAAGNRRTIFWLAAILVLILFGFATGIAYTRIAGRLIEVTPTQEVAMGDATTRPRPPTSEGPVRRATPTHAAATPRPPTSGTPPATPSTTSSPPPAPSCLTPVADSFAWLEIAPILGCARSAPAVVWAAYAPFERGGMLWRSDTDDVYAFFDDGTWQRVTERWTGQEAPSRGAPPPGLMAPTRGFGFVWGLRDDLFARLGWAREQEKGFCAEIQDFEAGFAVAGRDVPSCTVEQLFNHAATSGWTPIDRLVSADGRWYGAASIPSEVAQMGRPPHHGTLYARQLHKPLILDGRLDDWPDTWTPIQAIFPVEEDGSSIGGDDLSARMQIAWSDQGLLLAVRVQDDIFRPGPDGTAMWQGDGLELHIDGMLFDDYANNQANEDDSQIGLAPMAAGDGLRSYRWLPFAREGVPAVRGTATAIRTSGTWHGYNVEALIPWEQLGVSQGDVTIGRAFGFNLTVNDNDGSSPAPQTLLSFSPARTTHDDPTEWATLVLGD